MKFYPISAFMLFFMLSSAFSFEITEIMHTPSDGNEWIEFYTGSEINFSGYELIDNLHTDQLVCCGLSCNYIVPSGSFFLVLDQDSTLNYSGIRFCVDDFTIGNTLGNTNDKIVITKNLVTYVNTSYQKAVTSGNSITFINNSWVETEPTIGYGVIVIDNETEINDTINETYVNETETNETANETANETGNETCSVCTNTTITVYINNSCNYENFTLMINELSLLLNESRETINELENESDSKDETIFMLESKIINLTNKLEQFNGCNFNNPVCGDNYVCMNNQCVLKEGCSFSNPSCDEGYICKENICVAKKQVIFRTNINDGNYYSKEGEIAIDGNNDETLDCYKSESFSMFYFAQFTKKLGKTMELYPVEKLPLNRIIVRDKKRNPIYRLSDSCSLPLAADEHQGYIGMEVYKQ